jgi:hypothetical protein
VQSSCVEGQTLRASDVVRLKGQEGRLTGSSQCVPAPGVGNANSGGLADLAALSQDILHWQQKSATVVVCGDFKRIGRQGAEANAPSPVPQFER